MPEGLNPKLPKEGDWITVLGIKGIVTEIVPATPWSWLVKMDVPNGGDGTETMTLDVPTDYNTEDGTYCWADEPRHAAHQWGPWGPEGRPES